MAIATWGIIPSLSHIISTAACPVCHNIDISRRQDKDFIPSIPGFNGSFWIYTVSVKDTALSAAAGCEFCQVLRKVFRHVLTTYGSALDVAQATATISVPFNPSVDEEFHVRFRYVAAPMSKTLMQEISTTYYLRTIQKRTATTLERFAHILIFQSPPRTVAKPT